MGGAGTGGARSDLKRPTTVQLAPLPLSSTNNPNEMWDAWELKVQGKRGRVGEGTLHVAFLLLSGASGCAASLGELGCCVPRLGFKCTELRALRRLVWLSDSGGISAGGNTEPEPDRLASTSGGRAAGSESEWRQLPRRSLSARLRAAEPADLFMCVQSWGRGLRGVGVSPGG